MAIGDDFSVAANGDIRYTGTTANYTVIAFHRWLQDLADQAAASGNDILDITDNTPSERATDNLITLINGYNIDQTASEHLFDGSIVQAGGDDIWDGIVNFGNAEFIEIMQNGALIANDFWNVNTPSGFNADAGQGISHRFLVKTRTAGADIDGRRLLGMHHEFGQTYSEFSINGTARGNNVLALSWQDDLNNVTPAGTVATWDQFTNTQGYQLLNVTGSGTNPFYSQWTVDGGGTTPAVPTINDLYEYAKWLVRRGSTSTVYGLAQATVPFRGITHEITVDTPTGNFDPVEPVSWSGGTGQMLAIDSETAGTKMWIQLLSGVAPTDGQVITGGTTSATVTVNVTVLDRRPVPIPFIGVSTGSALIGGYGIGVDPADLSASDLLTDLGGVTRTPPNNVTFSVSGLVSGEDRVLVTWGTGSDIDKDQLLLSGTLNGAAVASVVVSTAIPSDTPQVGVLRVVNDSGFDVRLPYSSWTGSTFTLTSTYNFSGVDEFDSATTGNFVYIAYIDKLAAAATESFTVVYAADRALWVRVRDGGVTPIKTFESPASLSGTGGSISAIRTTDL